MAPPVFKFTKRFQPLFKPCRYKSLYGGRAGGKTYDVADFLLLKAMSEKENFLCARDIQNSIKDSVHAILKLRIGDLGLDRYFKVTRDEIRSTTGSLFIFKGLRHNIQDIKGLVNIKYCWVDEAQSVSAESWKVLTPTIRAKDSEIIITMNPDRPDDYTYQFFVENPPKNSIVLPYSYLDNKKCPQVLIDEANDMKERDYQAYENIWLGKPRINSEALIFHNKYVVKEFKTPSNAVFYHGADWGLIHPTTLVRCFIEDNTLYVDYEAGGVGIDLEDIPAMFDEIPTSRDWDIQSDSARPEVIGFVKRKGFRVKSVKKLTVDEGLIFMRSFDMIVIHPRCEKIAEEFGRYSFKVDRHSGQITPIIVKEWDHWIDALRYALTPTIRLRKGGGVPDIPKSLAF